MKRVIVFLLLLTYACSSLGISFDLFYCCGKLKRISIVPAAENTCCCKKKGGSCCSHQLLTYSIQHDQEAAAPSALSFQKVFPAMHLSGYDFIVAAPLFLSRQKVAASDSSPPFPAGSRHKLHCCFRI